MISTRISTMVYDGVDLVEWLSSWCLTEDDGVGPW